VAWGNPHKGAHASFAKFAGGAELPMHAHSADFAAFLAVCAHSIIGVRDAA